MSPRQLVAIADGKDVRDVDRGEPFLTGEIVSVHRDRSSTVLCERAGSGPALFQVLLPCVVHQEAEAGTIALLEAQVE